MIMDDSIKLKSEFKRLELKISSMNSAIFVPLNRYLMLLENQFDSITIMDVIVLSTKYLLFSIYESVSFLF